MFILYGPFYTDKQKRVMQELHFTEARVHAESARTRECSRALAHSLCLYEKICAH